MRIRGRAIVVGAFLALVALTAHAAGDPCSLNSDCDPADWCQYPVGICQSEEALGTCVQRMDACAAYWDPVCGCDWQTHSNAGCAYIAQVSVLHYGECGEPVCGGYLDLPCGPGEYCAVEAEQCGIYFGFCEPAPTACPEVCEPVCGCDGTTYTSPCQANVAGFSVLHAGPCDSPTDGLVAGVGFDAPGMLVWSVEEAALHYDVYRRIAAPPPGEQGWPCYVAGVVETWTPVPENPLPEETWWLQVTAESDDGEGPMGMDSMCNVRQNSSVCDPTN